MGVHISQFKLLQSKSTALILAFYLQLECISKYLLGTKQIIRDTLGAWGDGVRIVSSNVKWERVACGGGLKSTKNV